MSPGAVAVVGRAADAARVEQLAEVASGVRKSKKPWFSVKNGRLSLKKVSVALKFTTRSSLSTWPKSGLSVAVSWNWPFGFQKMSAPASKSLRAADVVVQARHVRRDRQQRLAVLRHFDRG